MTFLLAFKDHRGYAVWPIADVESSPISKFFFLVQLLDDSPATDCLRPIIKIQKSQVSFPVSPTILPRPHQIKTNLQICPSGRALFRRPPRSQSVLPAWARRPAVQGVSHGDEGFLSHALRPYSPRLLSLDGHVASSGGHTVCGGDIMAHCRFPGSGSIHSP